MDVKLSHEIKGARLMLGDLGILFLTIKDLSGPTQ
jgi:hypothetical protein